MWTRFGNAKGDIMENWYFSVHVGMQGNLLGCKVIETWRRACVCGIGNWELNRKILEEIEFLQKCVIPIFLGSNAVDAYLDKATWFW